MIALMNTFKVLLFTGNVGMWMYLVWSSVWLILCAAAPRSVCMLRRIPIHVNETNQTMMTKNVSSKLEYIIMKVCVHMPKEVTGNLTDSLSNMEMITDANDSFSNRTLPVPPLTKTVSLHETITITITCVIATLTLIAVIVCILRICIFKSPCLNDNLPNVESQRVVQNGIPRGVESP